VKGNDVPPAAMAAVLDALAAGENVIFPTDTVYGLAGHIFRPDAIRRIYALKGRSYKKPLPFLIARAQQARALVEPLSPRLEKIVARYWPGPLTVVFKTSTLGRWTAGGKETLALRVPDHPAALSLLRGLGMPLAVTSANRSEESPAVTAREALAVFRGRVAVVLDGGRCPGGEASTVLDAAGHHWTLVREGAVKKKELLSYLH